MTQTTTGIQLAIDFACTTTANVLLNANGTFGSITINQPAWQNPITQTTLFMNYRLTYF